MGDAAATAQFLDRFLHQAGAGITAIGACPITCNSEPTLCRTPSRDNEGRAPTEVLKLQSAARNSMEWFEESRALS